MTRPRKAAIDEGRTYGGESAADRLARQRQQFMDAGLELFGSIGYRATTVRLLCKEAGLIDRYFYKNFTDTEDLLAAVYTESMDAIQRIVLQALQPVVGSGERARIIHEVLDAFFAAFEQSRIARVCWLEVLGVSPRITALYTTRIEQFADLLITIARALLPSVRVDADDARYTGIALVGAISQSAQQWLLSNYAAPRAVLVGVNARLLLGTIEALAASGRPQPATH